MKQAKKVITLTFLVLTALIKPVNAQSINDNGNLLWKVSGKGILQDSYILLSTTSTCETKIVLNKRIKLIVNKVKQIVFETGATNIANEAKAKDLIALESEGQSAKKILTPKVYLQLLQKAEDLGINEVHLNEVSLWEISIRLNNMINVCGVSNPDRIEDALRYYANKNHTQIKELVSIEEYYQILDKYPASYMELTIDCLLNKPDSVKADIEAKAGFYKQENYAGIKQTLINSSVFKIRYSFTDIEMYRMHLLLQRIEDTIKSQPSLLLLDAADIANQKSSIFTLLKEAGYQIEPVLK